MSELQLVSVLLLCDHGIMRAGLRALIERQVAFEVIADGAVQDGVALAGKVQPAIAIIAPAVSEAADLETVAAVKRASPRTRVLLVAPRDGYPRAAHLGVDGYLSKGSDAAELVAALEAVHGGAVYRSPAAPAVRALAQPRRSPDQKLTVSRLTAREREVFRQLALGCTNRDVATSLDVAVGTIKKHRENLQRKLGCHSAAGLARLAIAEGVLTV